MGFVLKLTGTAVVLVAVFFAGYLKGSSHTDRMDQALVPILDEMGERIAGLEDDLLSLGTSARDRVLDAQNNIRERDLVPTEIDLETLKEDLRKTARLTVQKSGKKREDLEASIDELIESVRRSGPGVRKRLETVKTDLEDFLDRW